MQRQRNGIRNPDDVLREARMMRSLRSPHNGWIPGSDPLALLGPGNVRKDLQSGLAHDASVFNVLNNDALVLPHSRCEKISDDISR